MFHFLGFLFIIIISVLIIGLTLIGSVLRAIFGFGRRSTPNTRTYTTSNERQQQNSQKREDKKETVSEDSNSRHKKIFTKEEGEYVDYEDIKE